MAKLIYIGDFLHNRYHYLKKYRKQQYYLAAFVGSNLRLEIRGFK